MGDVELGVAEIAGQPQADHRDRRAVGDHLEVLALAQLVGQPARRRRQAVHHLGVARATQPQEVVVLADDLVARPGEVQGERRHVPAEVVHPEHQVLGQVIVTAPHHKADARIGQPVLVAADVDRHHPRQPDSRIFPSGPTYR